jgi:hypothetical protein
MGSVLSTCGIVTDRAGGPHGFGAAPVDRLTQTVLEVDERGVAEQAPRLGDVGLGIAHVAGAGGLEFRLQARAERRVDRLDQVEEADPPAGAHVECDAAERLLGLHRQQVRGHGVGHVSEVARLAAVAVDQGEATLGHEPGEERDDAAIGAGRVLPRAEDVEVAEAHPVQAHRLRIDPDIILAGELAGGIRAQRTRGHLLVLG